MLNDDKKTMHIALLIAVGITLTKALTDPTNIICTAVNSTVLRLTWTQATDASVLGYYLNIERVDGLRVEPSIPTVDLPSKSFDNYDCFGLGKYGTYNISINSYTSGSNLTQYVKTCTTDEDVPDGSPLTFYCTGIATSSLSCTWDSLGQVYWNGVSVGYRIQWLSSNVSQLYEMTVNSTITSTLVTGLSYGTTYMLMLNPYTAVGQGTLYTTTTAATIGQESAVVEDVTRYFCNEAVPGVLEFAWEEMPCTIYAGTIGALMVLCGIFSCIMCCQACCGKSSANNLSLNFFDSSNGRSRKREGDDDSGDDSESDDGNNENMSDDGQLEDLEDDGYENKGYRSNDEDACSADGGETESPDGESKSSLDKLSKTGSRQSGKMDSKGSSFEENLPKDDGRLTARDIQLEPIDEDEMVSDEDTPDSDYDTQPESENSDVDELSNNGNRRGNAKALPLPVKLAAQSQKVKTENVLSRDNNNRKNVTAHPKTSNKVSFHAKNKIPSTTVALIHTDQTNKVTSNIRKKTNDENPSENPSPTYDISNDFEFNSWGSPVQKCIDTVDTPERTASRKMMSVNERNGKVISPIDDWDIDDNGDDCVVQPKAYNENYVTSKVNNSRNINTKSDKTHKLFPTQFKSDTKEKILTDVQSYANDHIKKTENNTVQSKNRRTLNEAHEIELDSWGTPVFDSKNLVVNTSNREISRKLTEKDDKHITPSYPLNDWDKNDGWGDVFIDKNKKGLSQEHDKRMLNGVIQKKCNVSLFQSSSSTKEDAKDLDHITGNSESVTFDEPKNAFTEINYPKTGKHVISTDQQRIGTNTNGKRNQDFGHLSKDTYNENRKTALAPEAEPRGNLNGKEKMINTEHDSSNTNKQHAPVMQTTSHKKISFRDQQTETLKVKSQKATGDEAGNNSKFFIEDETDVILPSEQMQRPIHEQNGKMIPTRAWLPQSNNETFKPGRRTPVKPLSKAQSWTSVEIEPVLGSDRIGKRFPFLNIDNDKNNPQSDFTPSYSTADTSLKKNMSDSDLIRPTSDRDNVRDKKISAEDILSKFQKTKPNSADKIFYGFGTGRFRTVASTWLAKVRFKKSPVKTAQSDWR